MNDKCFFNIVLIVKINKNKYLLVGSGFQYKLLPFLVILDNAFYVPIYFI